MSIFILILLAFIQGMAELLPVSSSAHVILVQKLLGLDPSSPELTFLLVMLHTGTMIAVLFYFRKRWLTYFFAKGAECRARWKNLIYATFLTGVVGLGMKSLIEKIMRHSQIGAQEIEDLFGNLVLIGISLIVVGIFICIAGIIDRKTFQRRMLNVRDSIIIGIVQGFCLPFRGFSRSGSTISAALIRRVDRLAAEEFSFALALLITPPVIARELSRLIKHHQGEVIHAALTSGLIGMVFSFIAGLIALKFLSSLLEKGEWRLFGFYDIAAGIAILAIQHFYF